MGELNDASFWDKDVNTGKAQEDESEEKSEDNTIQDESDEEENQKSHMQSLHQEDSNRENADSGDQINEPFENIKSKWGRI